MDSIFLEITIKKKKIKVKQFSNFKFTHIHNLFLTFTMGSVLFFKGHSKNEKCMLIPGLYAGLFLF